MSTTSTCLLCGDYMRHSLLECNMHEMFGHYQMLWWWNIWFHVRWGTLNFGYSIWLKPCRITSLSVWWWRCGRSGPQGGSQSTKIFFTAALYSCFCQQLLEWIEGESTLAHGCRCTHYQKHILKCLKILKKISWYTSRHFMFIHEVLWEKNIFLWPL
jgi:hypothetical protein